MKVASLEALGINKRFGTVTALSGVDLTLRPGEVHALLGENGAGKSTLMNVLYGLIAPDRGGIRIAGRPVRFASPRDSMAAGIGMVHQHFALVPTLTVAENLSLGRTQGIYRRREAEERVLKLAERAGLPIDPGALVGDLTVGMQQRVEILKALSRDARILILDEPTGVLAPHEIDELLAMMRRLADGGAAVVFITHKLDEVRRSADWITVLRRGEGVASGRADEFTPEALGAAMVGPGETAVDAGVTSRHPGKTAADRLVVELLVVAGPRSARAVDDLSLSVAGGEILGVAGVEGSGQVELVEAITGLRPWAAGSITVAGQSPTTPAEYIDAGGAHIPEDRRRTGLILTMSIWENLILESHRRPPIAWRFWLDRRSARRSAEAIVDRFDVRTSSIDAPASTLSGGNQQTVVIGRELSRDPRVVVAVNPTRGLDFRSTAYVQQTLRRRRDDGGAILLVSSELDEVISLSDRIAVMFRGRIVAIVPPTCPRAEIGLLMTQGAGTSRQEGTLPA